MLVWLKENGFLPVNPDFECTCYQLKIAKWLHEHMNGITLTLQTVAFPYRIDIEFAQWAHAHRALYIVTEMTRAIRDAAAFGRLDMLQWLDEHQLERSEANALNEAVKKSYFKTAKWLYEQYPTQYFDDPTGSFTKIEMAKWLLSEYEWKCLRSRDAWIDTSIERSAFSRDSLDVIEILLTIRPNANCGDAIEKAAVIGNLRTIQVLHQHGAQMTSNAMDLAAASGCLDVVQWLHANRTEGCSTKAMDEAAKNGHFEVVKWLHASRSEGCTTAAMNNAAACGRLDIVQWLHANRREGCTVKAMDGAASYEWGSKL